MIDDLRDLHLAARLTILFVTHDPVEAFYFADRVAVLSKGGIVQDAVPDAMVTAPKTLDVAKLIYDPAPNILEGKVRRRADDPSTWVFEALGITLELNAAPEADIPERIVLVWRPRDARLAYELNDEERRKFCFLVTEGLVTSTAYYDDHFIVGVANGGGAAVKAMVLDAARLPKSEPVQVCIDPSRLLYFDADRQDMLVLRLRKQSYAGN
jgi:ABC-type sugar transport system ATPase subunit